MGNKGETRKQVKELSGLGLKPRQIAAALKLTTQAVYYHLARLEKDGAA